jgi:solute carrier family 25 phosphate transporter 23/24/25/41
MMSNTGQQKRHLLDAMRHVWALGGIRRYYRGLTVRFESIFVDEITERLPTS